MEVSDISSQKKEWGYYSNSILGQIMSKISFMVACKSDVYMPNHNVLIHDIPFD